MAVTISQEPKRAKDATDIFFVAIENGLWFEFEATGSPVETKMIVDVYLADATKVNANDIVLFFGVDNKVFFDVSPYLQTYIENTNANDYSTSFLEDVNASQGFYLKYGEYPVPSPPDTATSSTYYTTNSAKQFGDTYGQNMAAYVPFENQVALGKFLTEKTELNYYDNFPIDLSFIQGVWCDGFTQIEYDETGTEIATTYTNFFPTNNAVNFLNFAKISPLAKKIEIYLSKPTPNPGYSSAYSMLFDATGTEGMDANSPINFDNTTNEAFTIAVWIKPTAVGTTQTILSNKDATTSKGYSVILRSDGKIQFEYIGTAAGNAYLSVYGSTVLANNSWYLVICTHDGTQDVSGMDILVNIQRQAITTVYNAISTNTSNSTDNLNLAGTPSSKTYQGYINSPSIWNTVFNVDYWVEFYGTGCPLYLPLLTFSVNLHAWWDFDEGTFASSVWTIPDSSSNSYTLTSSNMESNDRIADTPTCDTFTSKYANYSIDFDGVTEYLTITNAAFNFSWTDSFSFSFWVKSDLASQKYLASMWEVISGSNQRGYFFTVESSGAIKVRIAGATGSSNELNTQSNQTVTANTWTHLVITYNGNKSTTGIEIYIDSVKATKTVNTNNLTSDFSTTTNQFNISLLTGVSNFYSNLIHGNTDVFNSVLTQANVDSIYNSGTPKDNILLSPFATWNMGNGVGDNGAHNKTIYDQANSYDLTCKNTENSDLILDTP